MPAIARAASEVQASLNRRIVMEREELRRGETQWDEQQDAVLQHWRGQLEAELKAHARSATTQRSMSTLIAVAIIILSAVVGSTFFRDISETGARLFFGILSLLPGVLTAVQKLLQLSEGAEKHALAAQRYRSLRREMEAALATPRQARESPKVLFQRFQRELDKIERDAPDLPYGQRTRWEMEFGVEARPPRRRLWRSRIPTE
jgi:hypothetical protein